MPASEFFDWCAYYDLHPFGHEWQDLSLAAISANVVGALSGKPQRLKDHMLKRGSSRPDEQTLALQVQSALASISQNNPVLTPADVARMRGQTNG